MSLSFFSRFQGMTACSKKGGEMVEIDILGGGITGLSQYMSLGVYNIGRDYASEAYKQPQTGLV